MLVCRDANDHIHTCAYIHPFNGITYQFDVKFTSREIIAANVYIHQIRHILDIAQPNEVPIGFLCKLLHYAISLFKLKR